MTDHEQLGASVVTTDHEQLAYIGHMPLTCTAARHIPHHPQLRVDHGNQYEMV